MNQHPASPMQVKTLAGTGSMPPGRAHANPDPAGPVATRRTGRVLQTGHAPMQLSLFSPPVSNNTR